MINITSWLSQRRGKSFVSSLVLVMMGLSVLSPSADARLIFTTEDDGAEADTYTLDVDGTVNATDNIDLSLVFGANLGEALTYNDSLGYFILTDGLNLQGDTLDEFKIGSNAGAPVTCNAGTVGYTYYDTTAASVMICNETSAGSGTYAFNSVEDLTSGSITTTEILDGTIATVDVADNAVTTAKIGTAGVGDANKVLTTDGSGDPQWEDKSNFGTSTLTSANIFVGNGSNVATGVALSGDATIDNTGTLSLAADSVDSAEIATSAVKDDEIDYTAVTLADFTNDAGFLTTVDISANTNLAAGTGITLTGDTLSVDLGTTIESAEITDGTITAADLGTNSVDSDEIAANAVNTAELNDGAVTSAKILDGTITRTDMAEIETFYTLVPEFSNFTLRADGSNNKGTMFSDHDTTTDRNYYAWSTRKTGALNDYDLVLQWMVPENFIGFSDVNPEIEIDYKTDLTTIADNRLDIVSLLDTTGTAVTLTGNTALASTVADTWVDDADITFSGGTFTPGEYITMTFRFASKGTTRTDKNPVYLGPVKFNIKVK